MTRECLRSAPWRFPALLDYLPLEQRTQRQGSQEEIRQGLIALGIGTRSAQASGGPADGVRQEEPAAGSPSTGITGIRPLMGITR